jgi:hypothetical protein
LRHMSMEVQQCPVIPLGRTKAFDLRHVDNSHLN